MKERRVFVRVAFPESAIRRQIKEAGGIWHPDKQAWEVHYEHAIALGLTNRIVEEAMSRFELNRVLCRQSTLDELPEFGTFGT
jgi:hypothetical protein